MKTLAVLPGKDSPPPIGVARSAEGSKIFERFQRYQSNQFPSSTRACETSAEYNCVVCLQIFWKYMEASHQEKSHVYLINKI